LRGDATSSIFRMSNKIASGILIGFIKLIVIINGNSLSIEEVEKSKCLFFRINVCIVFGLKSSCEFY